MLRRGKEPDAAASTAAPKPPSTPVAVAVKATVAPPFTLYVHTKVWAAPGASVTGPAGAGPAIHVTWDAPEVIASGGTMPLTVAAPATVTVSDSCTHEPGGGARGDTAAAAASVEMFTSPVAAPAMGAPVAPSVPVAVPVNATRPAPVPFAW